MTSSIFIGLRSFSKISNFYTYHKICANLRMTLLANDAIKRQQRVYVFFYFDSFSVFYYPIGPSTGFHFMFNCYYSLRLETDHFKSSPGDYFFLLFFNWALCVIIGLLFKLPVSTQFPDEIIRPAPRWNNLSDPPLISLVQPTIFIQILISSNH